MWEQGRARASHARDAGKIRRLQRPEPSPNRLDINNLAPTDLIIAQTASVRLAIDWRIAVAEVAQSGERQTEDLKVPCSIHGLGTFSKPIKPQGAPKLLSGAS